MEPDLHRADKYMKVFLWSIFGPLAIIASQILVNELEPVIVVETRPYLEASSLYLLPLTLLISLVAFLVWVAVLIRNRQGLNGRTWRKYFLLTILTPVVLRVIESIPGTKKCAKCHEYVREEAALCKHCGSSI
jgi:hypothetical protein